MTEVLLAVGTEKGLFLGRSRDRLNWEFSGPHFRMNAVYAVAVDSRDPVDGGHRRDGRVRLLVGADSSHWGPTVRRSDDLGATWSEPSAPAIRFPEHTGASLTRVWQLQPAGPEAPGVVYAGTEPAALFRSADGGETFTLVESLWEHPQRAEWGAGYGGQGLHTVLTDPRDPERLLVAISSGGVYRSKDGGGTWEPSNSGLRAEFLPEESQYPEFGQCVHKIARDAVNPDRLYLQNHGGVYRSDDAGASWRSVAGGLPADFGFAVAAHPRRADTAYVFPLGGADDRIPPDRRCRVFRTADGGDSWQPLADGLPGGDHYGVVLRDALRTDDADPAGLYFGTRTGEVYASHDEGERWSPLVSHLPDVLCVRAAVVAD
ncbi:exo-alpha-sialidase [Streptomyces sp. BE20]|uniref:WD40/YVTN/BNR-like repeat-containing protein n=1 Tax=Streptomyces sp. BE20 TaxID=3002525 RepID=UPI002E76FE2A|nr:exo-alpha-sialidase [Streptomyces sp. BE20]MEE1823482.1 exo-alpha-sialidase [Streptomyces sp. BE20]